MKKIQLLLFGLLLTAFSFGHDDEKDPIVLTINGEGIHQSEFLYIYTKNNANPSFKKAALDAYMELFINYKLKVKEAESLGYDTIPKLKNELEQYRKQLSMPYMVDKEKNEKLIEEAYYRTKNELHASHILIRVVQNASPEDTLKAYNKAMELRGRIIAGEDFGAVATGRGGSEDPSASVNRGDLGFFSAMQMVYPFEEAAFTTKVGDVSMPVRTKFGYHIIKVNEIREAKGKMKAAHIMILSDPSSSPQDTKSAEEKINEIYELLKTGQNFEDLAKKYSDDQSSNSKGGILPEFGAGAKQRMVPEFETAAFKLAKDGDYSAPFRSPYGFHIIKRIELTPVPTYEKLYRELKLKVEKDFRAQTTRDAFLNKLKTEYGFNDLDAQKLFPMFYETMDNSFFNGRWTGLESKAHHEDILFSFKDLFYTIKDFEDHLLGIQSSSNPVPMKKFITDQFNIWSTNELMKYEESKLEEKYPDFKALIREYREGILLFEIMQNEVWDKASSDTTGIKKYYESHKSEFTYPARYRGELYKCKDQETAQKVLKLVEEDSLTFGQIQDVINANSQLNLVVKTHTFNSETTEAFVLKEGKETKKGKKKNKVRKFNQGVNKIFEKDGEFYVFNVTEVMQPREREFKEAKGLVTAAYQNQLEKEWIDQLRSKYTLEIHHDALYAVGN